MNHVVEAENPPNEVAAGATPSAQYRKQPISPAIAYSMMLVIQARIMNEVTASAAWVLGSMPSGTNHSSTGTPTRDRAREKPRNGVLRNGRFGGELRGSAAVDGGNRALRERVPA